MLEWPLATFFEMYLFVFVPLCTQMPRRIPRKQTNLCTVSDVCTRPQFDLHVRVCASAAGIL